MSADLPHDGVWCRLGVSARHGVGVFAIVPIPQGTDLFANEVETVVWIEAARIDQLPPSSPQRRLYDDFAIRRDGMLGCPANFNLLSVGWYVNQPDAGEAANLAVGAEDTLIACRDIAEGEELTLVYAGYGR